VKSVRWFFKTAAIALGLTVPTVVWIQVAAWHNRNGWDFTGVMPNHFGEPYQTSLSEWVARGFISFFAWFGVAAIAGIWFLVVAVLSGLLAKRKKDRAQGEKP